MLYWPISVFMRNPDLLPTSKRELMAVGQPGATLSETTMVMCHRIAEQTPANGTSLTLIHSDGTPTRRTYLSRPTEGEWLALERGGFVADSFGFGFTLDALH